jgi:hypothetical protein
MTTLSLQEMIRLYYATGVQDCANVFDGNDVPTADDLREAWEYGHSDSLEADELPHAEALREAWVSGWTTTARRYVAAENARRAREEAEEAEYA